MKGTYENKQNNHKFIKKYNSIKYCIQVPIFKSIKIAHFLNGTRDLIENLILSTQSRTNC